MKDDFYLYQAQTTPHPLGLEISHASGSYIYDTNGKAYLDFVAGVSACSLGHCHPAVVSAVQEQVAQYMHVMVYGEYAQQPAVTYARELAECLPDGLEMTYLVNSGTEAMEGAIKLARRATGRKGIIAARHAYHGNTMGSLSLMDLQERKEPFEPLIPGITHIRFNNFLDLEQITTDTAAVVLETIQGGAGFILPDSGYLRAVRKKCDSTGALLILDEIQPGFGRTGTLFAFEQFRCIPDILVIGKGMSSGLPVGAFVASRELMLNLSDAPKLGHITTYGGNPVIAAAALATLRTIRSGTLVKDTLEKEQLLRESLQHPSIMEIRGRGLMIALILEDAETANELVLRCSDKGLILFWLLFEKRAVRVTPPLTISMDEIREGCRIIKEVLTEMKQ